MSTTTPPTPLLMGNRLSGKVALVTGGASGFGKGIATKFALEGCRAVIIADLAPAETGNAVAAELNSLVARAITPSCAALGATSEHTMADWTWRGNPEEGEGKEVVHFLQADATKRGDWEALREFCVARFGNTRNGNGRGVGVGVGVGVDIIVNNAGASYVNKATEEVSDDDFELVMGVNVKSVFLSGSVFLPHFLEKAAAAAAAAAAADGDGGGKGKGQEWKGACFIQIASTAGVRPRPRLTWYNASKAAVINATKTMAVEYGPQKIRFNSVSPVVGSTGMTHLFIGKPDTPENRKAFESVIPLGRGSTPADVANACCYLASDEGNFITGVNLEVDGGRCV